MTQTTTLPAIRPDRPEPTDMLTNYLTSTAGIDSREIAMLTGKQHAHICRDIKSMLDALNQTNNDQLSFEGVNQTNNDQSSFGSVYLAGNGEHRRCYILPKHECLVLITGYDVALRSRIIARWTEIEASAIPNTVQVAAVAPTTHTSMLGYSIRTVSINDDPWFVAKDICAVLGYERPNDAISQHCKGAVKHSLPTNGGAQDMSIIPERDVYRLIMRSRLPAAEQFEDWVVGEVLPAIRRTGTYAATAPQHYIPTSYADALQLAVDKQRALDASALVVAQQAVQITQQTTQLQYQQPAVDFAQSIASTTDGSMSIRDAANALQIKQSLFDKWLVDARVLYASVSTTGRKTYRPYANVLDKGYMIVVPRKVLDKVHMQPLVTPLGLTWLGAKIVKARKLAAQANNLVVDNDPVPDNRSFRLPVRLTDNL